MENHLFQVDLIFEPSGDAMTVTVDWDTDDPNEVMQNLPQDFIVHILENISVVPLSHKKGE